MFWVFVTIVMLAGMTFKFLEEVTKNKRLTQDEHQDLQALRTQLHQIEKRLENLETIIVDRDRRRELDELSRL